MAINLDLKSDPHDRVKMKYEIARKTFYPLRFREIRSWRDLQIWKNTTDVLTVNGMKLWAVTTCWKAEGFVLGMGGGKTGALHVTRVKIINLIVKQIIKRGRNHSHDKNIANLIFQSTVTISLEVRKQHYMFIISSSQQSNDERTIVTIWKINELSLSRFE